MKNLTRSPPAQAVRQAMGGIQHPFRETNRSPYYARGPGPYRGSIHEQGRAVLAGGETSRARSRESKIDLGPVFQHHIPPPDAYVKYGDPAHDDIESMSQHERLSGQSVEAGDPPRSLTDDVNPQYKSYTMADVTNLQRVIINHFDDFDRAPTSNGEHWSVAAYTASLLQDGHYIRRASLERRTKSWNVETPRNTDPEYAGSTQNTRRSRRSKVSKVSSKMISTLRSPCPELRRRVWSSGENKKRFLTPPPKTIPLPPEPPRSAPRPEALRLQTDKLPASPHLGPPVPLYRRYLEEYRRLDMPNPRGRQRTSTSSSALRGDSPIPQAHVHRSTIRGAHPPSARRIFAPQPQRPVRAGWIDNLAPTDTRFDTPLHHLGTEPRVAPRSPSLERLGSLLRLSGSAPELRPSLRGGASNSRPDNEYNSREYQISLEGNTRHMPINAVLDVASSRLNGEFPPEHDPRTDTPLTLHQPTLQGAGLINAIIGAVQDPISSQPTHMAPDPNASQPPVRRRLPGPSGQHTVSHYQQSQQQSVDPSQEAIPRHTDLARCEILQWQPNTDPDQRELLRQIESASRQEQQALRYLQEQRLGRGERSVAENSLRYSENRRRSLIQRYQHTYPQANNSSDPYTQIGNAHAYASEPSNVANHPPQVPPYHHLPPQHPSQLQLYHVPGSNPQLQAPINTAYPFGHVQNPWPMRQQQGPNYDPFHPRALGIVNPSQYVPQPVASGSMAGLSPFLPSHDFPVLSIGYPGYNPHAQVPGQPFSAQSLSAQSHLVQPLPAYPSPVHNIYPDPHGQQLHVRSVRSISYSSYSVPSLDDTPTDVFEIPILQGRELDPADPTDRFIMVYFGLTYWFDVSFEDHPRDVYEYNFGTQDGPMHVVKDWRAHWTDMRAFIQELMSLSGEAVPLRKTAGPSQIPNSFAGPSYGYFTVPPLHVVSGNYLSACRRRRRNRSIGSQPDARRPRVVDVADGDSTMSASLYPEMRITDLGEADGSERGRRQTRLDSEMPISFDTDVLSSSRIRMRRRRADALSEGIGRGSANGGVLLNDAHGNEGRWGT